MPDQDHGSHTTEHVRVPVHLSSRDVSGLMEIVKGRAPDPAVFDAHPPVFFDAEVSSRVIDAYSTQMERSSLQNYAQDASNDPGVPFQDSHKYDTMTKTLGRSVQGEFKRGRGDKVDRTVVTFFTQPTINPLMGEFVERMRSGLAADVSIGFNGGTTRCSICGGEMYGWWYGRDSACWHFPGVEYELKDEDGKKTGERKVAIGLIEDAHLSEVSTVFDGATPGAGIIGLKARAAQAKNLLTDDMRDALSARWQIDVAPDGQVWVPGWTPTGGREGETTLPLVLPPTTDRSPRQEETMPDKIYTQEDLDRAVADARENTLAPILAAIRGTGIAIPEDGNLVEPIRGLQAKIDDLSPRAADGDAYRDDLIEQVVDEGVRVWGNAFDGDAERAELRAIPLANVKRRLANYKPLGDNIFGGEDTPARATEDGDGPILKPGTSEIKVIGGRDGKRRRSVPAAFTG